MKGVVTVRIKKGVLDPEGDAVQKALVKRGHPCVQAVRVGKLIELELDDSLTPEEAREELIQMSDGFLANYVLEDWSVDEPPAPLVEKKSSIEYGKWTFSDNEEHWPGAGYYDTKEEAIAAAITVFDLEPGYAFWVGIAGKPALPLALPLVDGYALADQLKDNMYDSEFGAGDCCDGWLDDMTTEATKALEDGVNDVVRQVLTKFDLLPSWFCAQNVERVVVPEEES